MPEKKKSLELTTYDDIFGTGSTAAGVAEQIVEVSLVDMHLSENFPFELREDAAMWETVDAIKDGGHIQPCVARSRSQGGYEIVTGQRTMKACELAERGSIPAIILDMDDDSATIMMVNANLPQEKVLPSEMAWALRMKLEALCHRGRMVEGIDPGTLSVEILVEQTGKKKSQIYRYVHLTELVPTLLDMVDEDKIAFSVASEYLYILSRKEQVWLVDCINKYEATPSASQALRMKKASKAGTLTKESMDEIMAEQKKEPVKVTLAGNRLRHYFPEDYTPKQMEDIIIKLLENWQHNNRMAG